MSLNPEEFKKILLNKDNWNFEHDIELNEEIIKNLIRIKVKKIYKDKDYIFMPKYVESKIPNAVELVKNNGISVLLTN